MNAYHIHTVRPNLHQQSIYSWMDRQTDNKRKQKKRNNTVSQFAVFERLSREIYWTRRNVTQSKTQICLICPKELLAVLASIIVPQIM